MILLVGANGHLGGAVAQLLIKAKKPLSALVRDPAAANAQKLKEAGVALHKGDLKDRGSVEQALKGADTVICTATAIFPKAPGDSQETVDRDAIGALIDSAAKAGVKKFVYVSFACTTLDDQYPLAQAKRGNEKKLAATSMDYTILRPTFFFESWLSAAVGFDVASGKVKIYGDGTGKLSLISIPDVAQAVVGCLDKPAASKKTVVIGGPRAVSQLEIVELVEKQTGKKLQREHVPAEVIKAVRGSPPETITASVMGLAASYAKGEEIPATWTGMLGVPALTSPEDWIKRNFAR